MVQIGDAAVRKRGSHGAGVEDFLLPLGRKVFFASLVAAPWGISRVGGITLGDALTIAAVAIGLCSLARYRRFPRAFLGASLLILVACLALGATVGYLSDQTGVALRMAFVLVLIPFAALRYLQNSKHAITAILCYAFGAAVSATVAVGQLLGVESRQVFLGDVVEVTSRFAGLNYHPNGQAGSLAVATAFLIVLAVYGLRTRIAIVLGIINLSGLAIAASVTGITTVALALLLVLIRAGRLRFILKIVSLAASGALAWFLLTLLLPGLITPFDRLAGGLDTGSRRLLTIEFALDHIRQDVFIGVGFQESAAGTYDGRTQVHNMLVLAWYQGGVLFLAGVLTALAYSARSLWARASGAREAAVVASFAALFFAQTGPALYDRFIWVPIAILIALSTVPIEPRPINASRNLPRTLA